MCNVGFSFTTNATLPLQWTGPVQYKLGVLELTTHERSGFLREINFWKSMHQQAKAKLDAERERHKEEIEQTRKREAALREELKQALGSKRDLKHRLFGRKSEKHKGSERNLHAIANRNKVKAPRGQCPGSKGHGRTIASNLAKREEYVEIEDACCADCGKPWNVLDTTEDSEVVEIEVQAYRRVLRRRRYKQNCQCPRPKGELIGDVCVEASAQVEADANTITAAQTDIVIDAPPPAGVEVDANIVTVVQTDVVIDAPATAGVEVDANIVTVAQADIVIVAPPPARLINRGKYGISVWVTVFLDKFLYGRPSNRLLQDFSHHGFHMPAGTLAGGLKAIAGLFKSLDQAFLDKLRTEPHWHADETRWSVFVVIEGKNGHRWYLWVYHSKSVVHYKLAPSRATEVIEDELSGVIKGIISCDRYSAYKRFARLNPGIILAFCWAHQRRDFLELANAHPDLATWALVWVDAIGELFHLNKVRLKTLAANPRCEADCTASQLALEQSVQRMVEMRTTAQKDEWLAEPCVKVLKSMAAHWSGLTVFVKHPEIPMDNSLAERTIRGPVVGRNNFYGSGSEWSGTLAATMYSLFATLKLWGINPRLWLTAYLQACADNANQAPADLSAFLPWTMDAKRLACMREASHAEGIDSS